MRNSETQYSHHFFQVRLPFYHGYEIQNDEFSLIICDSNFSSAIISRRFEMLIRLCLHCCSSTVISLSIGASPGSRYSLTKGFVSVAKFQVVNTGWKYDFKLQKCQIEPNSFLNSIENFDKLQILLYAYKY